MISLVFLSGMCLWSLLIDYYRADTIKGEPLEPELNLLTEDPIVGREVKFNVSGIPDGSYSKWSIPNEGVVHEGSEMEHVFSSSGEFLVIVESMFEGRDASRNLTVSVRDLYSPNAVIRLEYENLDILMGEELILNGSLSHDEDGHILSYEWNIENKTIFGREVKYIFKEADEHWIGLTVIDNDGLTSTSWELVNVLSTEELIRNNLSLEVELEKSSFYVDDPLNLTVKITNNGSRALSINSFGLENLIISFSTEFYGWKTVICQFDLSSLDGDLLENRTWNSPEEKIKIEASKNLTAHIDLRNFTIYMGDRGDGEEWRTIDWFMERYMDVYWIDANLNVTLGFIHGNNILDTIDSPSFNIHVEWKPIYEFIMDRQVDNDTEEEILEYVEMLDYVNISGKERWVYEWGAKMSSFIDRSMIAEYTSRYNSQKNYTDFKTHIFFNYTASVHRLNNFTFDQNSLGTIFYYNNGSSLPEGYHGKNVREPEWEYKDNDLLNNTDLNKTDCYIVKMKFSYSLMYGPLGGELWYNCQWVVVTENFQLLYILSEPQHGVS